MTDLSGDALASVFAQETGEVWLILLTIAHQDLATPIYLVNNTEPVSSRGNEYQPLGFDIVMPELNGQTLPQVTLTIDNVGRDLIELMRTITVPPVITVEVVLANNPDQVETSLTDFRLTDIKYTRIAITGTLAVEDILREPVPSGRFTPSQFPGLFNS